MVSVCASTQVRCLNLSILPLPFPVFECFLCSFDDDAEPSKDVIKTMVSWSTLLPGAAVGFSGWNKSCVTDGFPFLCPLARDGYVYIRQVSKQGMSEVGVDTHERRVSFGMSTNFIIRVRVIPNSLTVPWLANVIMDAFYSLPHVF